MAGVGFNELVLLFIIGLLILGPERLPRVASQLGRWVGRARRTANQMRYQLEREIALADIKKPPKPPPKPDDEASGGSGDQSAGSEGEPAGASTEAGESSSTAADTDAASSDVDGAAEPTIQPPPATADAAGGAAGEEERSKQ